MITPSGRSTGRYFFVRRFDLDWVVIVIVRLAVGSEGVVVVVVGMCKLA